MQIRITNGVRKCQLNATELKRLKAAIEVLQPLAEVLKDEDALEASRRIATVVGSFGPGVIKTFFETPSGAAPKQAKETIVPSNDEADDNNNEPSLLGDALAGI